MEKLMYQNKMRGVAINKSNTMTVTSFEYFIFHNLTVIPNEETRLAEPWYIHICCINIALILATGYVSYIFGGIIAVVTIDLASGDFFSHGIKHRPTITLFFGEHERGNKEVSLNWYRYRCCWSEYSSFSSLSLPFSLAISVSVPAVVDRKWKARSKSTNRIHRLANKKDSLSTGADSVGPSPPVWASSKLLAKSAPEMMVWKGDWACKGGMRPEKGSSVREGRERDEFSVHTSTVPSSSLFPTTAACGSDGVFNSTWNCDMVCMEARTLLCGAVMMPTLLVPKSTSPPPPPPPSLVLDRSFPTTTEEQSSLLPWSTPLCFDSPVAAEDNEVDAGGKVTRSLSVTSKAGGGFAICP